MGQWLITPHADPEKAAMGAGVLRTPSRMALGEAYLVYADDWRWLTNTLATLPERHGRLGLWMEQSKLRRGQSGPGPQPWRLCRDGRFHHGRIGKRGSGQRTRWVREPWAVTDRGLWMMRQHSRPTQAVIRQVPQELVQWVGLLEINPLEILGQAGRRACECAICGRPLGPNSLERGIGPECLSLLGPLQSTVFK